MTFQNSKGETIKTVEGNEGDDIVDLSWEYDLDIEGAYGINKRSLRNVFTIMVLLTFTLYTLWLSHVQPHARSR